MKPENDQHHSHDGIDRRGFRCVFVGSERLFPRFAAYRVDDFVLEYAGEPGFDRGIAGKSRAAFKCRQQCFLHYVFGLIGVA